MARTSIKGSLRPLLMVLVPLPIAAFVAQDPGYPTYEDELSFVDGHKLELKDAEDDSDEPPVRFAGITRLPGLISFRESFIAELVDEDDQI